MAACLLCGGEDDARGDGCEVLIVGLEGSGKSLLCRRLQGVCCMAWHAAGHEPAE